MTKRICFMGKGGTGKSVLVCCLSQALTAMGYRVLQVGNDISLSSTALLRGEQRILPVLEEYREKYLIRLEDYVLQSSSGVYCLELGSIVPGGGCLARSLDIAEQLMAGQGLLERLGLDLILYDLSGDTPCAGYMMPIRDGLMDGCVLTSNGSFTSLCSVNSLLAGLVRAGREHPLPVRLLVNLCDCHGRDQAQDYARAAGLPVLDCIQSDDRLHISFLQGRTLLEAFPQSKAAAQLTALAGTLARWVLQSDAPPAPQPTPMTMEALYTWYAPWRQAELSRWLSRTWVLNRTRELSRTREGGGGQDA